jgi:hypothetical protein
LLHVTIHCEKRGLIHSFMQLINLLSYH